MKKTIVILAALLSVACPKKENNNTAPSTDVAADDNGTVDSGVDSSVVAKRVVTRQVPFSGLNVSNRLEDPNFGMQNESWSAFDDSNDSVFMRRVFAHDTPESRPYAGLLPAPSKPTCMLGRLKWGQTGVAASVWLAFDSGLPAAQINLIGLSIDAAPQWQAVPLVANGETAEHDGKSWQQYTATASTHFGWGFLEICNDRDEVLWVGAPTIVDQNLSNAIHAPTTKASRATQPQQSRIEAFESWRRKSADKRQERRRPR